jgi:tetratricopeptide (TPR) repeat protein
MRSLSRTRLAVWTLLGAAAVAGLSVAVFRVATAAAPQLYPEPPFHPVGPGFGEVLDSHGGWGDGLRSTAVSRATPQEREALVAALTRKFRNARESAENTLQSNPGSLPALYVLAFVHFEGEENFPRALHLVRNLRGLCEDRGRHNSDDAEAREWYIRALGLEAEILGDMDRREEQLAAVDCLEKVYQPLPWMKVWALMKLKREDEARAAVAAAEKAGKRLSALNGLGALEQKVGRRLASYEVFKQLSHDYPTSAVIWSNLGEGALDLHRYEEAEQAYLKAAQMRRQDMHATAYQPLAMIYLEQARFPECIDALKKGQRQRAGREPYTLVKDEARMQGSIAELYLALGRGEDAVRCARRAFEYQDRTGSVSADSNELILDHGLTLLSALCNRIEELRELPGSGLVERVGLEVEVSRLRQRLARLLDGERLAEAVRPPFAILRYYPVLPPGVVAAAIRQARGTAPELRVPGDDAQLDALEAEACLQRDDVEGATAAADRALQGLSASERLRRAHVAAVSGEAAARTGRLGDALTFWATTLRDRPVTFRLLGIALPVRVRHDGDPVAARAAELLRKSPRFREAAGGYSLRTSLRAGQVVVELFGPNGELLREASEPVGPNQEDSAQAVAREFLARLHRPDVDLTQINIGSLEGATGGPSNSRGLETILDDAAHSRGGR